VDAEQSRAGIRYSPIWRRLARHKITQSPKHEIDCKALKELYTDESGAKRKIKLIFVVHSAYKLNSAQRLVGSDDEKREAMEYVQQFVAKAFEPDRDIDVAAPSASAPEAPVKRARVELASANLARYHPFTLRPQPLAARTLRHRLICKIQDMARTPSLCCRVCHRAHVVIAHRG
jgi:hypothetical protein